MRLNVHPFTLKIAHHRPRVVCFVGKKIWDVYASVCGKTATAPPPKVADGGGDLEGEREREICVPIKQEVVDTSGQGRDGLLRMPDPPFVPVKVESESGSAFSTDARHVALEPEGSFELAEEDIKPSAIELGQTVGTGATQPPTTPINVNMIGEQPLQAPSTPARSKAKEQMDWHAPRPLRLPLPPRPSTSGNEDRRRAKLEYTYFWVTPSTSGLERTPVSH